MKLAFHDFTQDGVSGIVQAVDECGHGNLLRTVGSVPLKPCTLIGFCGFIGTRLHEGGIGSLFKLVFLEIVQQIQTVIGKFGLFKILLVHFYNGFSDLTNVRIYGEREEKGTRYPSECHH